MRKLPKLHAPVWIRFSSLRDGLGSNYGVVFDIDTDVTRKCMRIPYRDGWKWQICDYYRALVLEWYTEQDQEILSEYYEDIEFDIVKKG